MDERYCNEINKRIISGNLPTERLYPVPFERKPKTDRTSGMKELYNAQERVSTIIHALDLMLVNLGVENEAKREMDKALSVSETALVLNTGYSSSVLSTRGEAYKAAALTCPYVTPLDKLLCIAGTVDENKGWQHAIAFMLLLAQKQELHYGYTIDVKKIDFFSPIVSLILQPWDADTNPLLKKLSPEEMGRLKLLHKKRNEIHEIAEKERLEAEAIAKRTDNDWNLFLEMLFDRSKREVQIIHTILDESLSAKEKMQSLTEFDESVREHHDGLAMIRGHQEDVKRIYDSVIDRLNGAPDLSLVQTEKGKPFGINNEIVSVAARYCDFNRFQIKYHQFRIDSGNLETAIAFFSLANFCIQMTLGIKPENYIPSEGKPLLELVELFFNTIDNFYNQHKDSIESLRFSRLQPDAVASSPNAIEKLYVSSMEEEIVSTNQAMKSKALEEFEKITDKYLSTLSLDNSVDFDGLFLTTVKELFEEMANYWSEPALTSEEVREAVVARQIVTSINVIYLFRSALNMVIEEPETYALNREENIQRLKDISTKLKRRENEIVRIVYSEIDEEHLSEDDLDTYRERTGIDARYLSQIEKELANNNLFNAFNDELENMIKLSEEGNIEELLQEKLHLRERLFRVDDSGVAKVYVDKFDKISERLCASLVKVCLQSEKTFDRTKKDLFFRIGPESELLPESAINALVTAEMLYQEFANEEYAIQGFDYSGISALYYQAFEAAYNELVWRGYERELNCLSRDGKKYTDILAESKDKIIREEAFKGYLAKDPSKRRNYYDYDKKASQAQVKKSVMYKNFADILNYGILQTRSDLKMFREYFAHLIGFANCISMINDSAFMSNITELVTAIEKAADNRNNASHGGKIIDIDQLNADKKTVLSDLEAVRSDSLGLIQKLLFLMTYHAQKKTGT